MTSKYERSEPLEPILANPKDFIEYVQTALGNPIDLSFESSSDGVFSIVFITSITNETNVQTNILAPLGRLCLEKENGIKRKHYAWEQVLPVIPEKGRTNRQDMQAVLNDLLTGRTVLHLSGSSTVYSFNTLELIKRQPTDPNIERTVRGSRVSFVEVFNDNISLIRNLIRNRSFRVEGIQIGERTQTNIAVMYLQDVADPRIVQEVHRRLAKISIDAIINSGYIEQLITDNRWSLFPLTQSTELPDKVAAGILEGRVAILVNGSSHVVIVPTTVNELYQSPEDYYWGLWFGSFLRFFRILGNNLAVALPGLYIALLGVNPQLLPIKFALIVSGSRMEVAIPFVIELLTIDITVEIFREASLRLPVNVCQTLGITAGIVLSIAATGAGLVSNATLVVVIISAVASYSGPDYNIGLSWRILKYLLIFASAIFGLFGLTVAGLMVLTHAAIQNSFSVPYLAPWSPIRFSELNDTVVRRPLWLRSRPATYKPTDKIRYGGTGGKKGNE